MTPKIIILLGPDCCGKNFVMHSLAAKLDYEPFMCPRSPICNIVYDIIYRRSTQERFDYNSKLVSDFLEMGAYFVYIYAKPEILLKRAKARDEKHVTDIDVFKRHLLNYDMCFNISKRENSKYKNRFIKVDNSGSIESTIKKIMGKL